MRWKNCLEAVDGIDLCVAFREMLSHFCVYLALAWCNRVTLSDCRVGLAVRENSHATLIGTLIPHAKQASD
jgi:hypothetical protein